MRRLLIALLLFFVIAGGAAAQSSPAAELVMQLGRGHTSMAAAWSPDGTRLAIATSIGAWVYDTADWDAEPVLFAASYRTTWVEFSPAGGLLAIALADGTATVYDAESGDWLDRVVGGPVPERGAMANFNVAARYTAFVPAVTTPGRTPNGAVGEKVINDADGTELRLQVVVFPLEGEEERVPGLVSPDGATAVAMTRDSVTLLDAAKQQPMRELSGYSLPIFTLGFSSLGDALIVGQLGGTNRVYDTFTGALLGTYPAVWPSIESLVNAVDPISQRAAIVIRTRSIQIIDPVLGPQTLSGRDQVVTSLGFEPGGERIAAGFADGTLRIYDELSDQASRVRDAYAHFGHVLDIAWLPDSDVIVTVGEEGWVKLWQASRAVLGDSQLAGSHADEATAVAFNPADPTLFASASLDGTVKVWRLQQ